MSEATLLPESAADGSAGDAGRPGEARPAAGRVPPGRSYWEIVWRQFRKNLPAMIGLVMIAFLFLLAIFAPFLANKYPYYWYSERDGPTFPLFSVLSNEDLIYLLALALFLLVPLTRRLLRRTGWRFWSHADLRRAALLNLLLLLAGAGLLMGFRTVPDRVRRTVKVVKVQGKDIPIRLEVNFREEIAKGPQAGYLLPPVPYSPSEIPRAGGMEVANQPPSPEHVLGTDSLGRSVAARMIYGARTGLMVGFIAVGISTAIGLIVGGISAYVGGWLDLVLQRIVEIFICFPTFFLLLLIIAFWGPKLTLIMVAIGLTTWTGVARFIRAEILKIKTLDYITAARALGLRPLLIVIKHAVPNGLAPVLVSATFGIAGAVGLEASLSYLNLGDPDKPSWGLLLRQGHNMVHEEPSLLVISGFVIFFAILAYNLVGEGLRDAIDPRLKI